MAVSKIVVTKVEFLQHLILLKLEQKVRNILIVVQIGGLRPESSQRLGLAQPLAEHFPRGGREPVVDQAEVD